MSNAREAFDAGELTVVGGISHSSEPTLGLCIASLAAMRGNLSAMTLASGLTPMCASFNACLDFACAQNADILFHTASDVVVHPDALLLLLDKMNLEENYLTVGRGHDPIFGDGTSVGIWIWNIRIVGRDFRFRDVFKQDLDLCERIEGVTGKSRTYTDPEIRLGKHHPIWTPYDLYSKYLYSYPKYGIRRRSNMKNFLERGLAANPANKALLAGQAGLNRAESEGMPNGSKNSDTISELFQTDCKTLNLDGTDYYCDQEEYMGYAMKAMGSYKACVVPAPQDEVV